MSSVKKSPVPPPPGVTNMYLVTSPPFRYNDVLQRCKELDTWTQDLSLPSVVWLSGLFNPQSFLTGSSDVRGRRQGPATA